MRLNQFPGGTVLHLFSKEPDESFDGIFADVTAIAPNRVQYRASRQDAAWIPHQQFEQPEFRQGQINLAAAAESAVRIYVQNEIFKFQYVSRSGGGAPLQGADAREQFHEGKRFRKIV